MKSESETRQHILENLFGDISETKPDILIDGKPVWVRVRLLGGIEKSAVGISSNALSAQRDYVALVVDQERAVITTVVIPPEIISKGTPLPDENDRTQTRDRIAREYLLAKTPGSSPFIG